MALPAILELPIYQICLVMLALLVLLCVAFLVVLGPHDPWRSIAFSLSDYARFSWNCFLKPHSGDNSRNQQDALESFYKAQASVYDSTRVRLLRGRDDMLGLVAAQLKHRVQTGEVRQRPIWVDIGGGTGFNIEQMAQFVDVPNFFETVYLVDLSPSLCRVAGDRFHRLGWKNVNVICNDARRFRLEDHVIVENEKSVDEHAGKVQADLVTMSYSLSMIPEFYAMIDSLSGLLHPNGVVGVADFYVQSEVDYHSRNYIGGEINRHCMWISRVFWRTWFEADRVSLEAARRDFLEYRFGTITSFNARCHMFGLRIPYYVWIGCSKDDGSSQHRLARLNAAATESPFLAALDNHSQSFQSANEANAIDIRSKAYESAVINLSASLPLPSTWYQTHHWRLYYDDQLEKHRQFNDEYIYAFTWEDSLVDTRLLKLQEDDVVLAITSAGDNVLSYALERPRRIHVIDVNPSQNHLLELKLACFTALSYEDIWRLFGEGKHPRFRQLLITKLSPHMSSLAFQYWLQHGPTTFSPSSKGFYFTGRSRHALQLVRWLLNLLGITSEAHEICRAQTLAEQREIWKRSIRRVLLSRLLSWAIVSNKKWLWRALGVPTAQRQMIEQDFIRSKTTNVDHPISIASSTTQHCQQKTGAQGTDASIAQGAGAAIWDYAIQTLDPVINSTLLSSSNHYYLLTLLGHYTPRSHPTYLSPKAYPKLSHADAFSGFRIHTDEVAEVLGRMASGTLTVAVLMDSLDWFEEGLEGSKEVQRQLGLLRRALKIGGRVLLRSAGKQPWYVELFEATGFKVKRVGVRSEGVCVDRVNMYASTWLIVKMSDPPGSNADKKKSTETRDHRPKAATLEPLSIGEAMQQ